MCIIFPHLIWQTLSGVGQDQRRGQRPLRGAGREIKETAAEHARCMCPRAFVARCLIVTADCVSAVSGWISYNGHVFQMFCSELNCAVENWVVIYVFWGGIFQLCIDWVYLLPNCKPKRFKWVKRRISLEDNYQYWAKKWRIINDLLTT